MPFLTVLETQPHQLRFNRPHIANPQRIAGVNCDLRRLRIGLLPDSPELPEKDVHTDRPDPPQLLKPPLQVLSTCRLSIYLIQSTLFFEPSHRFQERCRGGKVVAGITA